MSLSSANLRWYMRELDLTQQRITHTVTETYRRLVATIFTDIVMHTPQFSGNLVEGWQIVFGPFPVEEINKYSVEERTVLLDDARVGMFTPYQRGDDPAVANVLSRELPKLEALRYNSIVHVINSVDYAEQVDAGLGPEGHEIRPENLYYGSVFMTTYAAMKYNNAKNLIKAIAR